MTTKQADIKHITLEPDSPSHRYIANPGPLGLFGFALVTFVLSTFNVAFPSKPPTMLIAGALFYGGTAQAFAGILDLIRGKTFSGTTFVSFGAFWTGQGFLMLPNISSIFAEDPAFFATANGIYHLGWAIFSFIMTGASLKLRGGSKVLTFTIFVVGLTLLILAIELFTGNLVLKQVAGATGLLAAALAWYKGIQELVLEDGIYMPVGEYKHERSRFADGDLD